MSDGCIWNCTTLCKQWNCSLSYLYARILHTFEVNFTHSFDKEVLSVGIGNCDTTWDLPGPGLRKKIPNTLETSILTNAQK